VIVPRRTNRFLTGFKSPEPVASAPDGSLFVGDWATGRIYRVSES
jgi:glucose/arabinose dehydrogenase